MKAETYSCCVLLINYILCSGPGSSVGTATEYGLDGPGTNPGEEEIFPPVQNSPGDLPASSTMGIGSFRG